MPSGLCLAICASRTLSRRILEENDLICFILGKITRKQEIIGSVVASTVILFQFCQYISLNLMILKSRLNSCNEMMFYVYNLLSTQIFVISKQRHPLHPTFLLCSNSDYFLSLGKEITCNIFSLTRIEFECISPHCL